MEGKLNTCKGNRWTHGIHAQFIVCMMCGWKLVSFPSRTHGREIDERIMIGGREINLFLSRERVEDKLMDTWKGNQRGKWYGPTIH